MCFNSFNWITGEKTSKYECESFFEESNMLNLELTINVVGRERKKCHKPQLGRVRSVGRGEVVGAIERKGGLGH